MCAEEEENSKANKQSLSQGELHINYPLFNNSISENHGMDEIEHNIDRIFLQEGEIGKGAGKKEN